MFGDAHHKQAFPVLILISMIFHQFYAKLYCIYCSFCITKSVSMYFAHNSVGKVDISKQAIRSFQHSNWQLYCTSPKIYICHFDVPYIFKGARSVLLSTAIHTDLFFFSPGHHMCWRGEGRWCVHWDCWSFWQTLSEYRCLSSCCLLPPIVLISSTNIHTITVATMLITSPIYLCPMATASTFITISDLNSKMVLSESKAMKFPRTQPYHAVSGQN